MRRQSPLRWSLICLVGTCFLLLLGTIGERRLDWKPEPLVFSAGAENSGAGGADPADRSHAPRGDWRQDGPAGFVGIAHSSDPQFVLGQSLGTAEMPADVPAQRRDAANEREEETFITPRAPNAIYRDGPPDGDSSGPALPPSGPEHAGAPLSPTSFHLERDSDLGAPVSGNIIGEVTAASVKNVVLATWNAYAAISQNLGRTWNYYNPATLFAWTGNDFGGFCCDQVAYYDQNHDIMIWILQFSPNGSGNNAIRFAWSKGASAVAAASFCYVNLTPQQLGATYGPSGTNYDQPKFARSDNYYYLQIQRYGTVSGSTVLKFPTSALSWPTCAGFDYSFHIPGTYSPGMVQRANATMYYAGHVNTAMLRVYAWPEGGSVSYTDVAHTAYAVNYPHRCPRTGGSGTSDWCQRRSFGGGWAHSDRIFTAWRTGGYLYFMWDSTQGATGWGTMTYPFIQVARISESTYTLFSEPHLWNSSFAIVYGSAALNDSYNAAGTLMYGGGSLYESCSIWMWDDVHGIPGTGGGTTFYYGIASNSDPNDTLSGDYASARRNGFNPQTWNGTCYTLRGGGAGSNMHPHVFWFGRERDFHNLLLPLIRR